MQTIERLEQYYPFDEDLVGRISEVAEAQNRQSFKQLAAEHGLASGPQTAESMYYKGRPLEFLHLVPDVDYDESRATVLAAPMGIPADANMAMRAIRLFDSQDQPQQLFVLGSPAHIGNTKNRPIWTDLSGIAGGDFEPLATPFATYLKTSQHKNIKSLDILGYSFGADMGLALAGVANSYRITPERSVWAEPASAVPQSLTRLAARFASSEEQLAKYLAAANSQPLNEARALSEVSFKRYLGGLARLSNLAIAKAMARGEFSKRIGWLQQRAPDHKGVWAWGTASELCEQLAVERGQNVLSERIGFMALEGMHHAGGDDIDLHAAIMHQGLRNASTI